MSIADYSGDWRGLTAAPTARDASLDGLRSSLTIKRARRKTRKSMTSSFHSKTSVRRRSLP
jgi:hypothetical protein